MKKYFVFFLALTLAVGGGLVVSNNATADVQIDKGQSLSTASKIFFVGRYARTGNVGTAGGFEISADSVVIWDTTSNDGVTVQTSTTSYDALVAGVTLDIIRGSSRDNTASQDESHDNWGRIQTWGRHADTRWQSCGSGIYQCAAGQRVSVSSAAQNATVFRPASPDESATSGDFSPASRDSFGVLLEAPAATDTTADIFVRIT